MYAQPVAYNQSPANAFRAGPYQASSSQVTELGRVVPGRQDERAMSMSSYSQSHAQQNHTGSGRVIPDKRTTLSDMNEAPNGYGPPGARSPPAVQTRTTSMASTVVGDGASAISSTSTAVAPEQALQHRPSVAKSISSVKGSSRQRSPLVYPALLSRVGGCFREKIPVGDRTKNDLTYKNAFSGAEAVDVISHIINTTDRNLALLLGRALDAQKFFHDVTYDHRLRDSTTEMYQFRETLMDEPHEAPQVNGVFVLLTECYSPRVLGITSVTRLHVLADSSSSPD